MEGALEAVKSTISAAIDLRGIVNVVLIIVGIVDLDDIAGLLA